MAIRIGHMKITFAPRGIVWVVWMKALFHEVCPETVNIRNVKNQPPPLNASTAVFEVQNRIPVFCAERSEIRAFATVDDLQSQDIFVEANGRLHVRNPKGNRRNLLNHKVESIKAHPPTTPSSQRPRYSCTRERVSASSKLLLVFYSSTYPLSGACQEEIISAWLAAQQAGEPRQARARIINPEPGFDQRHDRFRSLLGN